MAEVAVRKQLRNTAFDQMVFPDYEYREFPMLVYPGSKDGGKTPDPDPKRPGKYVQEGVQVESQAELDELSGPEVTLVPINADAPESGMRLENEDDLRKALYIQADQAGVAYDKRWSVKRIEDALRASKDVL